MAGRTHLSGETAVTAAERRTVQDYISGETAVTAAERRTVQDYIDELPFWRL